MAQAALQSVLTDITGTNKLEYEDPRWAQLFHSKQILLLRGDEELLEGFALRLIENNLATGNLMVLLSQTSSRIRQILEKRGTPTAQNLEQCCVSMHFTGLMLNFLFSRLGTTEIKRQLSLSADWPSVRLGADEEPSRTALPTGDSAIRQILHDALEVLSVPAPPIWMHDVIFCGANFLFCLFSKQLYQEEVRDEASNIFLSYVVAISEVEVRNALVPGSLHSISSTTPAKLVKSLVSHIIAMQECPTSSTVHEMLRPRGDKPSETVKFDGAKGGYFALAIQSLLRFDGSNTAPPVYRGNAGARGAASKLDSDVRPASFYPLREKCMNLLLIILYNRRENKRTNPFCDVFCMLFHGNGVHENEEFGGGVEMVPLFSRQREGDGDNAMGVDFQGLTNSLVKSLPSESSSLMLYALLNAHPGFLDYLMSSGLIEPVLCAALQGLYASHSAVCVDHLYVLIINVLMMVQDKRLRQTFSSLKVKATWYTEHILTSWFSLADLTMLCTLRCTLYALFKVKDQYLLSNCFAVILDLAPFLKNMGCYVSERIVKVVYQLAKRSNHGCGENDSGKDEEGKGEYSASAESSPLLHNSGDRLDAAVAQNSRETLLVLLKACSLALRPSKRSLNVHLLYALMHEHEKLKEVLVLTTIPGDSAVSDQKGSDLDPLMAPKELLTMAEFYLDKLQLKETSFISAIEAVDSLRSVIDVEMQVVEHQEKTHGLNFSYAEESNADNFFVPCAWSSMIRASPDIGFTLNRVKLFDPIEKKLVNL